MLFDPGAIKGQVADAWVTDVHVFERIGSTNEYLKDLARQGEAAGTVVIADEQTAGRGRQRRPWSSPRGQGLWFSVLLRPNLSSDRAGLLPLFAGLSVAQSLESGPGLHPDLKWPNDVLLDGRKVCGILVESEIRSNRRLKFAIVGIGLNVNQASEDFPPELRASATSLRLALGRESDRQRLLIDMLNALHTNYRGLREGRAEELIAAWIRRCPMFGQPIEVRHADRVYKGIFEALTESGGLVLRLPSGVHKTFYSGEPIG